jgi:hypothetical protein
MMNTTTSRSSTRSSSRSSTRSSTSRHWVLTTITLLFLGLVISYGEAFQTQRISPLTVRSHGARPYGYYATTKEKQKESTKTVTVNGGTGTVNGGTTNLNGSQDGAKKDSLNGKNDNKNAGGDDSSSSSSSSSSSPEVFDVSQVTEVFDEISRRINDGSMELFENITAVVDEKFVTQMPDNQATELADYISDLATKIQTAQQKELQFQLELLEKKFLVEPLEQIAFSDAPLFDMSTKKQTTAAAKARADAQNNLILGGKNSTLAKTSRMRSGEIIQNFNVAPLYYSVALFSRWLRKASYPSVWLLSAYKGLATLVKTGGGRKNNRRSKASSSSGMSDYEDYIRDAERMQSGWKRTGEIAAKGPSARKWAILRRSAEVWAYFSSFYLKDRRIAQKYQSGKWSEERFREERSKLGQEITQNLLRLGPTFIKVSTGRLLGIILLHYDFMCAYVLYSWMTTFFSPDVSFLSVNYIIFTMYRSVNSFRLELISFQKSTLRHSNCCKTMFRPSLATRRLKSLKKKWECPLKKFMTPSIAKHWQEPPWDRCILPPRETKPLPSRFNDSI